MTVTIDAFKMVRIFFTRKPLARRKKKLVYCVPVKDIQSWLSIWIFCFR